MKTLFSLFIMLFLLVSCNNEEAPVIEENAQAITELEEKKVDLINPAPKEFLSGLQAKANGIEATMYEAGASFSVNDQGSVYAFTSLITPNAPKSLTTNQVGHIMFLQNGENILLSHVFNNGSDVYMTVDDKETGDKFHNVLQGKAKELFTNVQVSSPE